MTRRPGQSPLNVYEQFNTFHCVGLDVEEQTRTQRLLQGSGLQFTSTLHFKRFNASFGTFGSTAVPPLHKTTKFEKMFYRYQPPNMIPTQMLISDVLVWNKDQNNLTHSTQVLLYDIKLMTKPSAYLTLLFHTHQ